MRGSSWALNLGLVVGSVALPALAVAQPAGAGPDRAARPTGRGPPAGRQGTSPFAGPTSVDPAAGGRETGAGLMAPAVSARLMNVKVPPPASGRTLDRPSSIRVEDLIARIDLMRDHLETIRIYMGRPVPPAPLIQVEGVRISEVFVQSMNLYRRVQQLGFEQLRTSVQILDRETRPPSPALILEMLNRSMFRVLQVKQGFGLTEAIAERVPPDGATVTEVMNKIIETGALVNALLVQQTNPAMVYSATLFALQIARRIHAEATKEFLPPSVRFEPAKTPTDVYAVIRRTLALTRELGAKANVNFLKVEIRPSDRAITSDDLTELIAIMISELAELYTRLMLKPLDIEFVPYLRKLPAHSHQRALELEAILKSAVKNVDARR